MDLFGIGVPVPLEDLGGEPGVQQEHVTGLDDDVVGRHNLLERLAVDPAPVVAQVMGQVDQDAPPLHALVRHVLQAEMAGETAMVPTVAGGIGLRPDQVYPGAVPVVVDRLFDPVAVGVELGADVGQRVPLRRVLQGEGYHVVRPHVDVLGIAPVLHLAHADVVEGVRDTLHVLGRRQHRRVAALIEGRPARVVEGEAQAEADAGLDLAHALEHLLGREQVDAAQLVVLATVPPGRAGRTLFPPLRHGLISFWPSYPATVSQRCLYRPVGLHSRSRVARVRHARLPFDNGGARPYAGRSPP